MRTEPVSLTHDFEESGLFILEFRKQHEGQVEYRSQWSRLPADRPVLGKMIRGITLKHHEDQ